MMGGNVDVTVGQNRYLAGYLPVQAIARHVREGLLDREGGGQPRTDWHKQFIADNHLKDFGLVVQK